MDIFIKAGLILCLLSLIIVCICLFLNRMDPHAYKNYKETTKTYDGKVEFIKEKGKVPVLLKRKEDGSISDDPFKILICSDMHNQTDMCDFTLKVFERFLDRENPDLVVLCGDNVVSVIDTKTHEKLKEIFERRKLYYGFVLGNHDSEKWIYNEIDKIEKKENRTLSNKEKEPIFAKGRKWAFESLSNSPYCVCTNDFQDKIYGSGNCVVNIINSKGISQSLFFIDSGDYVLGVKRKDYGTEKRCYNYIRPNQLEWYKNQVKEITIDNHGIIPTSTAFFHIPLPEYQKAFVKVLKGSKDVKHFYGTNFEKVCSSDLDDGTPFKAFKENNTKTIVVGHDHKNDSQIEYQGVRLVFSQGLQFDGTYNRRKKSKLLKFVSSLGGKYDCYLEGVSIFMVNNDGSIDYSASYASKNNFYDGLTYGRERALWEKKKK